MTLGKLYGRMKRLDSRLQDAWRSGGVLIVALPIRRRVLNDRTRAYLAMRPTHVGTPWSSSKITTGKLFLSASIEAALTAFNVGKSRSRDVIPVVIQPSTESLP